jgi:hypothetical protein
MFGYWKRNLLRCRTVTWMYSTAEFISLAVCLQQQVLSQSMRSALLFELSRSQHVNLFSPYTMNIAYECSGAPYLILSEICTQNLLPVTCVSNKNEVLNKTSHHCKGIHCNSRNHISKMVPFSRLPNVCLALGREALSSNSSLSVRHIQGYS